MLGVPRGRLVSLSKDAGPQVDMKVAGLLALADLVVWLWKKVRGG